MINAAIMLVAIFFYFTVQTLQYSGIECTTGWLARVLSINTANFICLLTLPCFAVITVSLASVRPVDFRGLLLSQLPIVFFLIAYIITGSITVIHCCQAYAALYYIMVQVVSLRQVIRYQEQIRQTYSNLTEREIWWAIAYKVPIAIMFFFWSYAVSQNHPLYISIFEAGTMIFVAVYVRKIELQNYQMEEMSVIDATQPMPVPEGETDVTEQHLDPLLGKQIEQYCVGQRAFTNPDLSVGDVVKALTTRTLSHASFVTNTDAHRSNIACTSPDHHFLLSGAVGNDIHARLHLARSYQHTAHVVHAAAVALGLWCLDACR